MPTLYMISSQHSIAAARQVFSKAFSVVRDIISLELVDLKEGDISVLPDVTVTNNLLPPLLHYKGIETIVGALLSDCQLIHQFRDRTVRHPFGPGRIMESTSAKSSTALVVFRGVHSRWCDLTFRFLRQ